jgi:ABC-type lipoprotein export system ATPase subunit/bifunctional DNA-binding transcriptional regulator/antitoxin component of YhaV-PrlF toxin-antitoxin module
MQDVDGTNLSSNNNLAIVCDNLVKIYKIAGLEVVALQGLDLVVKDGEMLGIVGASGSGKSTLLNILGGLDRPSAGRVWTYGADLLKFNDRDLDRYRRTMVGFVWQQSARNLIPYLTAVENIEVPMTLSGLSGAKKRRRAEELLDAVGLADRKDHHLSQLSGGEQQRIAIAVALANDPRLLLADEPTGEVDEATSQTIYNIFKRLNHEMGQTILIVSHDPGIAREVDRVVAIRDGKTAAETVRTSSRRRKKTSTEIDGLEEHEDEEIFDELTVLDSAGRLQIPKEYLEHFGIRKRVRLEIREDSISILPILESDKNISAEDAVNELSEVKEQGKLVSRLERWWSRRRGQGKTE